MSSKSENNNNPNGQDRPSYRIFSIFCPVVNAQENTFSPYFQLYLSPYHACSLMAGDQADRAAAGGVDDPVEFGAVVGGIGDGGEAAGGFVVAAFELAELFAGAA